MAIRPARPTTIVIACGDKPPSKFVLIESGSGMENVGVPSAPRQAGKTARGRSDCHFRHPACVENRLPVARRSASLWATDDQSLVPAPYLAAHFRKYGGRRSSS